MVSTSELHHETLVSNIHSFSTSPNLCQCTTVLIAAVPNCHNAVCLIVSVRLLAIASSIRRMAPHDLIILYCKC